MQSVSRPPLGLPKRSPVSVTHFRADNDRNGNPRRCFVVTDRRGYRVEVIDEGYSGEEAMTSRYPWFNYYACERLGLEHAWISQADTTPSEYRRMLKLDSDETTAAIRNRADRYARRFDAWGKRHGAR